MRQERDWKGMDHILLHSSGWCISESFVNEIKHRTCGRSSTTKRCGQTRPDIRGKPCNNTVAVSLCSSKEQRKIMVQAGRLHGGTIKLVIRDSTLIY